MQQLPQAILIEGLRKTYSNGFEALKGIDLTVNQGEFFGLLGPNGAGKSTLINILAGLVKKTEGTVQIAGFDLDRERAKASMALGVVPQEVICDPFITVRETLAFQSGYYGLSGNDDWIDELIDGLGLSDKAFTPTRLLSGGMKRRVLIAQALVHKPPVIVLDEPTAGVDLELRHKLWEFVGDLHRQGHTVILTTHYLQEAQNLCSRIAIINHGEVVAVGATQSLLSACRQTAVTFRLEQGDLPVALSDKLLRREGSLMTLAYTCSADLAFILSTLQAGGLAAEGITTRQADLEDVFLSVLDRSSE